MQPRPYYGSRKDHHRPGRRGGYVLDRYAGDQSGEKTYRFNSLGYRGDEFDPEAQRHIFAIGCSNTLGVGLDWEETWPYQFKLGYAAGLGLDPSEVNLLNFSQGGASNAYILRTALSQLEVVRPDVLLVLWTSAVRAEYVTDDAITSIGPRTAEEGIEEAEYFYLWYTPELGFIDTVKDQLLLQYYAEAHEIPYVWGWVEQFRLNKPQFAEHPVCSRFAESLDRTRMCELGGLFRHPDRDLAADGMHAGPLSNVRFGQAMLERFEEHHPLVRADRTST